MPRRGLKARSDLRIHQGVEQRFFSKLCSNISASKHKLLASAQLISFHSLSNQV